MKTIAEIHAENLDTLASGFESQRQFALHLNKDPKQVNQWWGKGSARGIGPKIAREIEERFGKPIGWLDNDHSQLARLDGEIISAAIETAKKSFEIMNQGRFDPEADPEIFAQAIRTTLAKALSMEQGDRDESARGDGQAGLLDRPAGPEEARHPSATAPRARKAKA
ncbi:hypothetical protein [Stenotrophomonas sp. DR009]|uniref:hypothetical protein n=1 Tax=Stenotrophomonas sp. DR009 TaxID=3398461 RepID=UPI003BB044BA